jgi:hypothetical protein
LKGKSTLQDETQNFESLRPPSPVAGAEASLAYEQYFAYPMLA